MEIALAKKGFEYLVCIMALLLAVLYTFRSTLTN